MQFKSKYDVHKTTNTFILLSIIVNQHLPQISILHRTV